MSLKSNISMFRKPAIEKLNRRNFLAVLGVSGLWPLAARAQQPTLPVVGFLSSGSPRAFAKFLKAFQQGLSEVGFVDGRNLAIVYRWAEGHFDELDTLASVLQIRSLSSRPREACARCRQPKRPPRQFLSWPCSVLIRSNSESWKASTNPEATSLARRLLQLSWDRNA